MKAKNCLKISWLLVVAFLPGFLCSQSISSQSIKGGKVKWAVKDPFEHKVFIENKGQFNNAVSSSEKILYFAKIGNVNAYFTAHGLYYKIEESFQSTDPDKENEHPEEWQYTPPVVHTISMNWQGASTSSDIAAGDEITAYFTYSGPTNGSTIKANAFKKITYKNIYPFTDIVYTFPEKGGIEYSIVLHPGADAGKIKMDYSDKNSLQIGKDGSISHTLGTTELLEYAPQAHYVSTPSSIISSSFQRQGDMVMFQLGKYDAASEVIIDPWVIVPHCTVANDVFDIGKDLVGNIYVQGGGANYAGGSWEVQKYNSAGAFQWSYTTPWSAWKGGFACDGTGCTYTADGCCTGQIVKLTPSGTVRWTITTGFTEYWMMAFNCSLSTLYMGIGLHNGSIAVMDTATGALTGTTIVQNGNETRAMGWAPNTNIYFLTETSDQFIGINSAFTNLFTVASGYVWGYDPNPNYVTGNNPVTGHNAIAAGLTFVATSDGAVLDKRNLSSGALISSQNLPGGSAEWYSGITVDYCGNIFVGVKDSVIQYDSSLHWVAAIHVPDSVYAVIQGNNSDILAGGMKFLADLDFPSLSTSSVTIAATNAGCSNCNATAKATLELCGVADTTTVTYLWSNGNTNRMISGLCAGTYTVTVSGCFQNAYKDSVTISAGGGLTVTADSTSATCANPGSASITSVVGGTAPYTYKWSNGSTSSSSGPVGAGIYCVDVKDHNGCSDSLCIHVIGTGLPTITVTPNPDTICGGGQVALTASGAGVGGTYAWTPAGSGLSCYNCSNPTASPSATTIYTVVGTDINGCKNKDSVIVAVLPSPTISISAPNDSICAGQNLVLTASGGVTYSWTDGHTTSTANPLTVSPLVNTTYTVTGTNAKGCTGIATFTVYISELSSLTVSPNVSICPNNTVTLTASQTSGSGSGYQWQPGGSTSQSITVSPTTTTTYTVSCNNACGIVSRDVTVTVLPVPKPSFESNPNQGCAPMCIQFRNLSSINGGGISQYGWAFGNGDTSNSENPIYCYPKPGVFTITLTTTSDSGCSATLKIDKMITVYSKPVANFTASPQPTTMLQPVIQFTNTSKDAYGIAYQSWNFGDNGDSNTSTLQEPEHTYGDSGTYCVKLEIMNIHGCRDTTTNCVVIDPIFAIYIPSAFSPNGDGLNETFMAKGNDVKTFEMYIFDRWGMQLFHSTDITKGWNGTVGGGSAIAQEDTYVYLIHVTDNKNNLHSYTGNVNLIK